MIAELIRFGHQFQGQLNAEGSLMFCALGGTLTMVCALGGALELTEGIYVISRISPNKCANTCLITRILAT